MNGYLNVLVVDDNRDMVSAMTMYLTKKGFKVQGVHSVPSALDAMVKEKFDVIIVDVHLKQFSGISFLKSMRSRRVLVPVIMTSNHAHLNEVHECLSLGAYDFIFKPFRLAVLADILQSISNRKMRLVKMGVTSW